MFSSHREFAIYKGNYLPRLSWVSTLVQSRITRYQSGCICGDLVHGPVPENRRDKRISSLLPLFSNEES